MENTKISLWSQLEPFTGEWKTCRKCGKILHATSAFFYKQKSGKFGVSSRCKPCVNEDNKISQEKRRLRDPDKFKKQASERTLRHYYKNLEESRKKHREHQAKNRADPEKYEKIKARKRAGGAGLTQEQINELFVSQGSKCAICHADDAGSKAGWNVDHCHKSKRVRFILCAHCNRGLGAFKDNTDVMRRAAQMLDEIYDNQPNHPVRAK